MGRYVLCKGNEDHELLAIADCTGHGIPGVLMNMMLSSILDAISREFSHDNPAEMLTVINTRHWVKNENEPKNRR